VRHVRIATVCLVAACATCALAAANASAALPEWGKCVKLPATIKGKERKAGKGKFANSNCTEATTSGEYEFEKGTEGIADTEFTNTLTTPDAVLEEASGLQVICTAETATGSLSGTKEVSGVVVRFKGCALNGSAELPCENAFKSEAPLEYIDGEIFTHSLKGKLGYISGKGTAAPVVGLSLEPERKKENKDEPFAFFGCLSPPILWNEVGANLKVHSNGGDSIISPISPVNTMGTETTQVYRDKTKENSETHEIENEKGIQEPTSFEDGKPDYLETRTEDGYGELAWTQSSQIETAVTKLNSGEELEIKA
jgi:hypothetical protein